MTWMDFNGKMLQWTMSEWALVVLGAAYLDGLSELNVLSVLLHYEQDIVDVLAPKWVDRLWFRQESVLS